MFKPMMTTQVVCRDYVCASEYGKTVEKLKAEKQNRKAVITLRGNNRSFRLAQAQVWFNKFIRLRDSKRPCISCESSTKGKYDAGHYRSRGSAPELRFDEDNCHKQCSQCNTQLSGNLIPYRVNLVKKIGIEKVRFIEGPHKAKKYSIDDIREIEKTYKSKCKEFLG